MRLCRHLHWERTVAVGRTAKSKPKKKATPKNSDHQNTQGFNAAEIKGAADADTKKKKNSPRSRKRI